MSDDVINRFNDLRAKIKAVIEDADISGLGVFVMLGAPSVPESDEIPVFLVAGGNQQTYAMLGMSIGTTITNHAKGDIEAAGVMLQTVFDAATTIIEEQGSVGDDDEAGGHA
jgi:hypothetical protein